MSTPAMRLLPRVKFLCAVVSACFATEPFANPVGPSVVAGQASFASAGKALTVSNSPNAIINWQGFSVGAGEITRFQQQSAASAVLNRVVGQDPSAILGTLSSNGRVYLVNPNGVLFGQGSRVDVAGLVATTLNLSNSDFLAGRLNFEVGAVANSLVNQGEIVSSSGGRILLVAPDVQNHGLISSPQGEVVLAAGKSVQLVEADLPQLKVEVQAGGEALNVGRIISEGGKIGVYAGLINQRGVVRADSVSQDATGKIIFRSSDTTILDSGSVTSASGAKGGEVQALGNKVGLLGNARIDASGEAGGGTVLVGGDLQGKNPEVQNAFRTYFGPEAAIRADALTSGDGGKVIVWSDDATRAYGTISAKGGALGGDGGFVEVSGRNWLDFQGMVDTSAPKGAAGVLLLDPSDVDIVSGSDSLAGGAAFDSGNPNNIFTGGSGASSIGWGTIKTHLTTTNGGTNVIISTSPTFSGQCTIVGACGDIDIINDSPDLTSSKTLRLLAHRHINVTGGGITNSGGGALEMWAGWDGGSTTAPALGNFGNITITKPIDLSGTVTGDVLLHANNNITDTATLGGVITAGKLLASTNSGSVPGSVLLDSNSHMVDIIAGNSSEQFLFKNGKPLEIGTVAGVNGINVAALSGFSDSTINIQLTSGSLLVTQPIAANASDPLGAASITLTADTGAIGVTNGSISAQAITGLGTGAGGPATVVLQSGAGTSVNLDGGTVSAIGGEGVGGFGGGAASVTLTGPGQVNVANSSTISATGGIGGPTGGAATVTLSSTSGGIGVNGSSVGAVGGDANNTSGVGGAAKVVLDAASSVVLGDLAVPVTISATAGTSVGITISFPPPTTYWPAIVAVVANSGNIESNADITANGTVGTVLIGTTTYTGSVVLDAPNGHIHALTAGSGLLTVQNGGSLGAVRLNAKNGIGQVGAPIRIADHFAAIFATNTTANDVVLSLLSGSWSLDGSYMSVSNTASAPGGSIDLTAQAGDIYLASPYTLSSPNGSISLTAAGASAGSGLIEIASGTMVSAPNGNVTFTADNQTIDGTVSAATGTVVLTPYSTARSIYIATTPFLAVVPVGLVLHASELALVSAGTLEIGRSTDSGFLRVVNGSTVGPWDIGAFGTVRLAHEYVTFQTNVTKTSGGDAALDVRTKEDIFFSSGADVTSTSNKLHVILNSDRDANGSGIISLGSGTAITTNGGDVTLGGGATPATVAAIGGLGGAVGVALSGASIDSGAGNVSIRGQGQAGATDAYGVYLSGGAVIQSTSGTITVTGEGGTGGTSGNIANNIGLLLTGTGSKITSSSGNITLDGTGNGAGRINDGIGLSAGALVESTSGTIGLTGRGSSSGSANDAIGVAIEGTGTTVRSLGSGPINISGTGRGTSVDNHGVSVSDGGTVVASSTAPITITGAAPSGAAGIEVLGAGVSISTASGAMTLATTSGDIELAASGGSVSVTSGGAQSVSASGTLGLAGGSSGTGEFALLQSNGTQTVGAASITLTGGEGTNNNARIKQVGASGTQTVTVAGTITATGGGVTGSGSGNDAGITQSGSGLQHVTASSIQLTGGGGVSGSDDYASINTSPGSTASQQIDVLGSGGLAMLGGTGSGGNNKAGIWVLADFSVDSGTSATQTVTVSGGGSISATGGENGTNSPSGNNNNAGIYAAATGAGSSQTVTVTGTGNISLLGGPSGIGNHGNIWSLTPSQTVTVGSGGITLQGDGGASGTGDRGWIRQEHTGGSQTISSGGSITVSGGTGSGGQNAGQILSAGSGAQSVTITAPGKSIALTGGTGDIVNTASFGNIASIDTSDGNQTISGNVTANNPNITINGGASGGNTSGGPAALGNNAFIRATLGTQSIAAGSISQMGGNDGFGNGAFIQAGGTQGITVSGGLSLTGGGGTLTDNPAYILKTGAVGAQTITVNGGNVTLQGGSSQQQNVGGVGHGSRVTIEGDGDTQQILFTLGGTLSLTGGTLGSRNFATIYAPNGSQTISGSPTIILRGGASGGYVDHSNADSALWIDEGNYAQIRGVAGQSITASAVTITGGGGGTQNYARFYQGPSSGTGTAAQTITASSITLTGGADGGAAGDLSSAGNHAGIQSRGFQTISAGSGGIDLTGGSGSRSDNAALIEQLGTTGTQTINVSGGSIDMTGGSSTRTNVGGTGHGSRVSFYSEGSAQQINFIGAGSLTLSGGTVGSRNWAQIFAENTGSQTITGSPSIVLMGGANGGVVGEGNSAFISTRNGAQDIAASAITLTGGTGGTENLAQIFQGGAGATQSISVTGGGTVDLNGGGGTSNFARIRGDGTAQSIDFVSGGSLDLSGGTGATSNYAQVHVDAGTQTISGTPAITLTGGSSGGAAAVGSSFFGNDTSIRAAVGTQTIQAGAILINAGAGGTDNSATIQAPTQVIDASTVTIHGGGASGSFAGARMGGIGGNTPGATNLTLTASGEVTLTGGSVTGAAIGSNGLGNVATDISITSTGGSVILQAGTGAGVRIGSPSGLVAGGNISVTAANGITLDNTSGFGAAIRTAGSATLTTTGASSDITLGGTIDLSAGTTGVLTLDAGHAIVSTGGVLIPNTSATQPINLKAVAGIGTQADPIRFADANLSLLNTGTTGDIAIALVATSGDLVIDGSLTGVLNSNPTGTYYLKSEGGNVQLDVPFRPDGLPLAAGQSVVFAAPTGSVRINSLGSIQAAGSGNVTLTAGNTSAAGLANGVYVNGGQITAEAGTIALTGYAKLGNTVDFITTGGVVVDNGAIVHTTSGPIDITGTGGSFASGLSGRSLGIRVTGAGTEISTVDGPISLTGLGGSMLAGALGFADTRGIRIDNGALVQATAAGSITLDGTGGTGVDTALNGGILVTESTVTSNNGDITLTGRGGSSTGAAVPLAGNYGVSLGGLVTLIESTGSGSIAITGVGGTSENSAGSNAGVLIQQVGVGDQTTIRTADGSITIDGTGGSTTIAGGGNSGVQIYGSLIQSTGAGAVTLLGQAGSSADSTPNRAILVVGLGGTIQTNSGALELSATGDLYLGDPTSSGQTVSVSTTTGSMTLGATGDLVLGGGTISATSGGLQTITAAGDLMLTAGSANNESVSIQSAASQIVSAAGISLTGGGGAAADNFASIYQSGSSGSQSITVTGGGSILLQGGSSSGGSFAFITANGTSQSVNFPAGGAIDITGGSTGSGNSAGIYAANGSQAITGAPAITLTGGPSGGGVGAGNYALIAAEFGAQSITADMIDLTGGDAGVSNFARIYTGGNQSISATGIMLSGGLDGGGPGTGNFAQIRGDSSQSLTVGSGGLLLFGGSGSQATASDNFASLYQAGTSGTQSITVGVGGSIVVVGGDGVATSVDVDNNHGTWAFIRADGTAQNISFSAPGGLVLVAGGDNGSGNYAGINARNGTQTITGSPDIFVSGGSTGGIAGEGNWAQVYANAGQQSVTANAIQFSGGDGYENFARLWSGTQQDITAAAMSLSGGASGTANYAVLNAPLQNISVTNDLVLMGGASAATATSGGGARIGGFGGATPSDTNVTLNVGGNLMMTGGDAENSGSAIGSGILGGQTTHIGITVGGNVTLDPGTVVNAGSRIGSPAASIGSGIITVTAGGDIVMNGTASGIGTAIRTAGSVALQANSIMQATHTTIAAGSLDASTTAGASLLGAGNAVNAFSASNTTSGAIELLNTSPTLTLSAISQVGGAAVNIDQSGDLVLPAMTFDTGTISASGTAGIPSGATFTAAGGTLSAALLQVQTGGTLNLASGTLGGAGDIAADGTMNWTGGDLSGTGKLTVGPTGTLDVSGASSRSITNGYDLDNFGSVHLTHSGVVFVNGTPTTFVTNSGAWNANQTAAFGEETGGGSVRFTNAASGTISRSATGSGTILNLSNDGALGVHAGTLSIDNRGGFSSAGTFLVDSGATLRFVNSAHTINGSFLAGSGAGTLALSATTLDIGANVSIDDAVQVPSGTTLNVNTGASASLADVTLSGGTLGGAGNVTVTASLTQTGGTQSGTGNTVIGAAATGTIGAQSLSRNLQNQGTLNLNGTTLAGSLANSGTFNVGGTVSVAGGVSQGAGTTSVAAGQTLSVGGPGFGLAGGTLQGSGTVIGDVSNTGGTVQPGTSAGILTIDGNYTQSASGALAVEIGGTTAGTEYDRLVVSGSATLGGTLSVLEGTVAPVQGTTYTVITCGTCSGTFVTVSASTVSVTPNYGGTSVTLPFTAFINNFSGGVSAAWEDSANWSRGTVPTSGDDVVVPGTTTVTVSSGAQTAHSIVIDNGLTLSGGSLNLAAPSTVGGTFSLSGGTLTGAGTLAVNQLNWTAGTIGAGGTITAGTGGATLTNSSAVILDGRTMTVNGPFTMAGTNWLDMYNGAVLTVNGIATLNTSNLSSGFFGINTFGAPATVNYVGGITKTGALPFDQVATAHTQGTVQSQQGELVFDTANGGTHAGTSFVAASGALIKIANGAHVASGNVTFSGAGITQLGNNDGIRAMSFVPSGGTLTNNGTLNVVPGATLGALTNQGTLNLTSAPVSGLLTNSGTTNASSASLGAVNSSGTLNLDSSSLTGLLTNSGALNVGGTVSASGGIQQNGGLITVPLGQILGVGGSGLMLAGGTLMGNGTISGNVNNSAGTVAPGASPGMLTINGNYTQGPSGTLAVEIGGTIAGSEYDQLVVNGNVFLDGNLNTTLVGSYVPASGDSYTYISASGTITGNFANTTQPPSLQPPVVGVSPVTGAGEVTVSAVSASVPPQIEPSYNYTVVASEISSEPVENILVPVLGGETTTTSGDTTLEKKPPACS